MSLMTTVMLHQALFASPTSENPSSPLLLLTPSQPPVQPQAVCPSLQGVWAGVGGGVAVTTQSSPAAGRLPGPLTGPRL